MIRGQPGPLSLFRCPLPSTQILISLNLFCPKQPKCLVTMPSWMPYPYSPREKIEDYPFYPFLKSRIYH